MLEPVSPVVTRQGDVHTDIQSLLELSQKLLSLSRARVRALIHRTREGSGEEKAKKRERELRGDRNEDGKIQGRRDGRNGLEECGEW